MDINQRITEEIEKIRPFLNNDGGDIEFVSFKDGIVHVKLTGACAGCSMIDYTLKDGIEEILTSEIPEVVSVVNDTVEIENWH